MKQLIYMIIGAALIFMQFSCSDSLPEKYSETADSLIIYPDYQNVVIPCNVAPLNFKILNKGDEFKVMVKSDDGENVIASSQNGIVKFPLSAWQQLLKNHSSEELTFDVYSKSKSGWMHFPSFNVKVVPDSIDKYVTFRWIEPSYENTGKIGMFEYDMETAEIKDFVDNLRFKRDPSYNKQRCMNCHTTQPNHPENSVIQFRTKGGGMIVTYNGKTQVVSTKVGDMKMPSIFERWHPSLPYIVFSNNSMSQTFKTKHYNMIESMDLASDLLLYDIVKNEISYILKTKNQVESYPIWSADGNYLYYCKSDSMINDDVSNPYRQKYDLMKIRFNVDSLSWGVPTCVYNATALNKSVSKPRVSPDDKYIIMTVSEYGGYHFTHQDADVYLLNLQTDSCAPLKEVNSSHAECYTTWSSTGRWILVSSRREDDSYARLYFAYFDKEGKAYKPFQMPHENPMFDRELLKNYNYPEFATIPVNVTGRDFYKVIDQNSPLVPNYRGTIEELDAVSGASNIKD